MKSKHENISTGFGINTTLTATTKLPEWAKKIKRNENASENYFTKRYGEAEGKMRRKAKAEKLQEALDKASAKEEGF